MAAKKAPSSALPLMMDNDQTPSATITYANEVVAIIAGLAANEVEGIAGMCSVSSNILNKNRNASRGVKVEIGTEEVAVDLYVIVEYGTPIQRAAMDAQESVRKAIETMTGLHVVRVDVHVQSVSFEQENKLLEAGAASAALEAGIIEEEPEKTQAASEMEKLKAAPETVKPKSISEAIKAKAASETAKPEVVAETEKPEDVAETAIPESVAETKKPEAAPETEKATVEEVPAEQDLPAEKQETAVEAKEKKPVPRKKAPKARKGTGSKQSKPEENSKVE